MTTRGIFILETVRSRQREGSWVPTSNVFGKGSLQEKGYIVGGKKSGNNAVSNYQSIDYSSDTLTNIANLPYVRRGPYGVSSPSAGYTIGGFVGPGEYNSNINKLTLSTQTNAALPGANLSAAYGRGGSCGSSTAGFVCGGYAPAEPNGYTRLEKLTYSTETMERIPGSNMPGYPSGVYNNSASGDGDNAGYWVGGATQGGSRINKLTYSTDSWGTLPNLPGSPNLNRSQKAGQASSDTGFYLVGGSNPYSSRIQKVTFASGTNSIVTNSTVPTNNGRFQLTGTGSPSSGYFAGGTETSIVEKMNFSTNGISRLPALDLSTGLSDLGSLSSTADNKILPQPIGTFTGKQASPNFGYSIAGRQSPSYPGPGQSSVYKYSYDTETSEKIPSLDLGTANGTRSSFAAGNSTLAYTMGGINGTIPGDGSESGQKLIYASDTQASAPNHGGGVRRLAAFAMSTEQSLYTIGGYGAPGSSNRSNAYKYSYANDSWSGLPASNTLSQSRRSGASYASTTDAYAAGGFGPGSYSSHSNVDKIAFSSDTVDRATSANLPQGLRKFTGVSSPTAGYSFGGYNSSNNQLSVVYKTTFSNDTSSSAPSFPSPNNDTQNVTNQSSGFVMGGNGKSEVFKYDFTTETFSNGGSLPTVQWEGTAASAGNDNLPYKPLPTATPTDGQVLDTSATIPDAGYNMKGNTPGGLTSRISKIAFATDTKSNPGNMPTTGEHSADFSSLTAAYSNSGAKGPSGLTSNAQKVTYSTDSASNVPGGQHNSYQRQTGCSTMTHGYLAGGFIPGPYVTNFNKMTFSNETYSLLPAKIPSSGFPNPSGSSFMTGFNNSTAGYWGGGEGPGFPSGSSGVVKLTFATDTSSANPGKLPTILKESASLGNGEVAGYTVSGGAPSLPGSGHISYTSKMLYSSETFSLVPGAYWNPVRYRMTTFSSFIAGYAGMGSASNDAFSKMPWSTETWSSTPGNFPSGSSNTRDTGGGTSAKSNSGGKPKVPVVL